LLFMIFRLFPNVIGNRCNLWMWTGKHITATRRMVLGIIISRVLSRTAINA